MATNLNNGTNAGYGSLPELKVGESLTVEGEITDVNSPHSEPCVTEPFSSPESEINEDEQFDEEDASKVQDDSICEEFRTPETLWSTIIVDETESSDKEESTEVHSSEEHDASDVSLSEHAVEHCEYEVEGNYGSPVTSDDSLNELQDSFAQVWITKKQMYHYAEYSKDVYSYFREAETRSQPQPTYMQEQPEINLKLRSILVDWLVDLALEHKFQNKTLYLAVSYIDRFLSVKAVLKCNLLLVGFVSMFLATKLEQRDPLTIEEFLHNEDHDYLKSEIFDMERLILTELDFRINVPTIYCFLQYICCTTNMPKDVLFLAQYLCELTLLEGESFFEFLPSQIAAAAIGLSRYTMKYDAAWDEELEKTTGYKFQDITHVTERLHVAYLNSSEDHYQGIRQKYNAAKYKSVSSIPAPEELLCL